MIESQRDSYEFHFTILSVKMKVKFPCKMRIEYQGNLITGETTMAEDNRYAFNHAFTIKDDLQSDCFQLTINLLTEKGAKYIAGVARLYQSELVRSEGERLVIPLTKCIDSQAFCEIKVDQISNNKTIKNAPYDRKSTLIRDLPARQREIDLDFSPHRSAYNVKIHQSKSEYQFPLHQNGRNGKNDWQTKSKSRYVVPQKNAKARQTPRMNYVVEQQVQGYAGEESIYNREKIMQAEVYKQGYEKLKQKYRKQTELNKQELNRRLALENSQNNLKLELMRLKLKNEELQKGLNEKNAKLKDYQNANMLMQQKQSENISLREENARKEQNIRLLQDRVRTLSRNLQELRDMAAQKAAQESNRVRQLQLQMQNMKSRNQNRQRQLQRQLKIRTQQFHEKQIELVSKTDFIERERKTVADLQKSLQLKNNQMQKLIQNERNSTKAKLEEQKLRNQQTQKELHRCEDSKKQIHRQLEQLRSFFVKLEYEKKIAIQELESIKSEYSQAKGFKEKYNELSRDHRTVVEQKSHSERQLQKVIQNKQSNIMDLSKQMQEQVEYYKRMNRELEEKNKSLSNKIIEVQGQLEISKSQQDKLRRNYESLIKQSADAKQREKTARKGLKTKEQQSLSMETEVATLKQKLKSIDQIYKLQVDKLREENDKINMQYENELNKNEELREGNNQVNMEINKLKIKLQYAEEKIEKDSACLKDRQNQLESLVKDYEEQVSSLQQAINAARLAQKELITKLQKSQLEQIRMEQRLEKLKKEIKVLEERCNNSENNLKQKISDTSAFQSEKQSIQNKYAQLQVQANKTKSQNVVLLNQKNKLAKMSEILNEQIKKGKGEAAVLNGKLLEIEKQQQQLRSALKVQKQQFSKSQLKLNTLRKQVQRNKEVLLDVVQKNLFTLPLGSKQQTKRTIEQLISKKTNDNTFAQYFNMIIIHAKDVKQTLTKQSDLIRQLQRQRDRLQELVALSNNKYQSTELTLKRQIDELDQELQKVIQERQVEVNKMTINIQELNQRIDQMEMVEEQLNNQIEELNFTNNSTKLDFQALNEQNSKKISNLRKLNSQLEQKVEQHLMTISQLEQRCGLLEEELDNLQITVQKANESISKKNRTLQQLSSINQSLEKMLQQLKRSKKELGENKSELQMHLHTQKQLNDKNKQLLAEEEAKNSQLKTFLNDLMKQKEESIKKQLEESEGRLAIQSQLHQLNKELELVKQQNAKHLKNIDLQKESNRKLNSSLKELDLEKKEEKAKYLKTQQKLKEKERQMLASEQAFKKLQFKSEKALQKLKSDIKELEEQLQNKNAINLQHSKDSGDRIIQLENTVQKKTALISSLQGKIAEYEQSLFGQRQKITQLQQNLISSKIENEQLLMKVHQLDSSLNEKEDQLNLKEEKLFELSGRLYSLEQKLEMMRQENLRKMEQENKQWEGKYESMCQEYQQRAKLIEKETDYFKRLNEDKGREISKLNSTIKSNESMQTTRRKSYEEKIKKLQDDRLAVLALKNNELQRIVEENTAMNEQLKSKQSDLRRLGNQLEVARKTITNLDQKYRDYDEKFKGVNKVYQTELQQLKKKDLGFKAYRESVTNFHWNMERQIKKGIQNFIKNFLDLAEDKNSQKIVELARTLQKSFIEALAAKPQQK